MKIILAIFRHYMYPLEQAIFQSFFILNITQCNKEGVTEKFYVCIQHVKTYLKYNETNMKMMQQMKDKSSVVNGLILAANKKTYRMTE